MTQVLFFGSSSVYGVGGELGSAADYLKCDLHAAMYGANGIGEHHAIFNLGISGASTEDLLDRMPKELQHRSQKGKTIVFFSGGGNDTKFLSNPDDTSMDEQYRQNLQKIVNLLKKFRVDIVLYGMTPVDETKTNPRIHADGTKVYFFNRSRKRLEKIMEAVAEQNRIEVIPLIEETEKLGWLDYLYEDGLHPNTKGHKWIADKIRPALWRRLDL
ncbi:hypothetical protein A3E49_01320 [Candidatus Saccharibacteria bacterium RIFCSPHIGHO2_12_FULL_49_19]|nr:MAG: hypothetical protein A3E49_01320 [Candidatus Saccharibacteria bacterium RIFCSPHIGHO2_12_FULL_49_19]